jgi:O-antigen ligase
MLIRERTFRVLGLLLAPVVVNATVLLLQVAKIWNPFRFPAGYDARLMHTGLIGNANDMGVYLVVPAVVAMVLTVVDGRLRVLWLVLGVIALAAIAMTLTITAMIAVAAAALVLCFNLNRRLGIAVAVLIPIAVIVAIMTYAPLRERAAAFAHAAKTRDVEALTSQRLVAFTTTWEMFRDHPLLGVGPGCFPFEYMPYRLLVDERHPLVAGSLFPVQPNFGEAHNDHLQLLAETGLPGYALFLAGLWLLVSISRNSANDEKARTSKLLALPLATAIFVSCLAQFPLHLAAPLYNYLFAAAACFAWGTRDVA